MKSKMKEENIDDRIEKVIRSVASKKSDMELWDRGWSIDASPKMYANARNVKSVPWRRIYKLSAAAIIVVVFSIGIGFYVNRQHKFEYDMSSPEAVYRSGSDEISDIQALIGSSKYDKALQIIDESMADTTISPTLSKERREYLRVLQDDKLYELTWLKIIVFIKTDRKEEAADILKTYVDEPGEHQDEAKLLLKDLKKQ